MPGKPVYAVRAAAITKELQRMEAPYLDRRAVQKLLQVGETQARGIMGAAGTQDVGGGHVVAKEALIRFLDQYASEDLRREADRQRRFATKFRAIEQEAVEHPPMRFEIPDQRLNESARRRADNPPAGIRLDFKAGKRGKLEVDFDGGYIGLLQKLAELATWLRANEGALAERVEALGRLTTTRRKAG